MQRAESIRVMHPLFQEGQGGSIPTSALSLSLETIDFSRARELNRLWHSRLPRMGTGCIARQPFLCFAAVHDGLIYAVAIWSNPVARNLPQDTWLELRRLAIAPSAPRNTASRMLAVMARLIRRLRPGIARLVSYQDTEVHTGGIYRAAGWTATTINKDGRWNRPGRSRPAAQSMAAKQRWEKAMSWPPLGVGRGLLGAAMKRPLEEIRAIIGDRPFALLSDAPTGRVWCHIPTGWLGDDDAVIGVLHEADELNRHGGVLDFVI